MYKKIFFILLLLPFIAASNPKFDQFNKSLQNGDFKTAKKIIDNWGNAKKNDPQYYICSYNYYSNMGRHSGIAFKKNHTSGKETLALSDSKTGNAVGYMEESVIYDKENTAHGIKIIKQGIKKFPNHFEMRYGLLWLYSELYQYNNYLDELNDTLKHLSNNPNSNIYWNYNKVLNNPHNFVLNVTQENFSELMNNQKYFNNAKFSIQYCNLMIKYFPKSVYGYTNKGVLYSYKGDFKNSLKYFFIAHQIDKNDVLIVFNIAMQYKKINDKRNAKKYFNKIIKINNDAKYTELAKKYLQNLK